MGGHTGVPSFRGCSNRNLIKNKNLATTKLIGYGSLVGSWLKKVPEIGANTEEGHRMTGCHVSVLV